MERILDTDYVSYAVIWNCSPYGLINSSMKKIDNKMKGITKEVHE